MKKQVILLLIASTIISNIDAAANRFRNWFVNNRSRIALTGAALSSGAAAYYWSRNQPIDIDEETSKLIWEIRNRPKEVPKKEVKTSYSETISGSDDYIPIVDPNTGQVEHLIQRGGLIPYKNKPEFKPHIIIEKTYSCEHPGPCVIECPRVDFEGRHREYIQFCGDKPAPKPIVEASSTIITEPSMPDQIETPFVTHGSLNPPEPKRPEHNYSSNAPPKRSFFNEWDHPYMIIDGKPERPKPYYDSVKQKWIDPCNNCNNR